MGSKIIWVFTIGLAIGITCVSLFFQERPVVEVFEYNDTPANYRDGFGVKEILAGELPPEKYHRKYKYVMISNEGEKLDGQAYLLEFNPEGDAVVKRRIAKESERLIIFSDFEPNGRSQNLSEKRRARWLIVKGG